MGDMHSRTGLVQGIKRLIGKITVTHISFGKVHTGFKSLIGIIYIMVCLIFFFNAPQYFQSLIRRSRFYHHFLEASLKSTVLLNILTILVKRCRAYALHLAS